MLARHRCGVGHQEEQAGTPQHPGSGQQFVLSSMQAIPAHLDACEWEIQLLLRAALALNSNCMCYCCSPQLLLLLPASPACCCPSGATLMQHDRRDSIERLRCWQHHRCVKQFPAHASSGQICPLWMTIVPSIMLWCFAESIQWDWRECHFLR